MSANVLSWRTAAAIAACLIGCLSPLAAQNFSTPVNPQFRVELLPDRNAPLVRERFVFSQSEAKGGAFPRDVNNDGLVESIYLDFDDLTPDVNFPWTNFTFGVPPGGQLEAKTYPGAKRTHIFDGAGNVIDFGHNHVGCDTVGEFTITRLEIESQNVGLGSIAIWQHHVIAMAVEATMACSDFSSSTPKIRATITYSDDAKGTGEPGGGGPGPGAPTPAPPPPPPNVRIDIPAHLLEESLELGNNGETSFEISTATLESFAGDVHLSVISNAPDVNGLDVSIDPVHIPAPGVGKAQVRVKTGPMTLPRNYMIHVIATTNDERTYSSPTVHLNLVCDVPLILALDQPKGVTVAAGQTATVTTKVLGSGPLRYQWYRGPRGSTRFPVAGANSATLTVSNASESQPYWVRVSNACGSVDSHAAFVTVR